MDDFSIEGQLDKHGELVYTTVGTSMQPMLYENDTVVRIKKTQRELGHLELPLYKRPDGKYIIHRILFTKPDMYIICGDNCVALEKVPKDWILGVVTEFYRNGMWHSVNDWDYRLYCRLWFLIYPLRKGKAIGIKMLVWVYHVLKRLFSSSNKV